MATHPGGDPHAQGHGARARVACTSAWKPGCYPNDLGLLRDFDWWRQLSELVNGIQFVCLAAEEAAMKTTERCAGAPGSAAGRLDTPGALRSLDPYHSAHRQVTRSGRASAKRLALEERI